MGLFDTVRSWFSTESSAGDVDQELRRVLRTSIEIVSDFGAVLEQGAGGHSLSINRPESDLPHSKQQISQAIAVLQQAIRKPHLRTILVQLLSPAEAQHASLSQFEKFLEVGPVFLETFIPSAEFEAERKQLDEMLKLAEEIDPGARERIENSAKGRRGTPKA